jgi:ADP-heptose:LPS heptosyltransferase
LKLLDKLIGSSAVRLLHSPNRDFTGSPASILFIRPGGIGDALLLIPVIEELKTRFPDAAIDVLAEKRNSKIFSLCPLIKTILHYDNGNELLIALRNHYDVVIDTEQWHRLSAVVARLTRAPMLVGFATNDRRKLFIHPIPYSHDEYEQKSFFNLIRPLTPEYVIEKQNFLFTIPIHLSEKIEPLLQPLSGLRIVALFPGGSIQEKRWDIDKFCETAKRLIESGYGVVIIGGKEDIGAGHAIEAGLDNLVNFCGQLSLIETAAVLQKVELLISGDSGIMHLGAGLKKKIVALFGPGNVKKWAPRGGHVAVVTKNLDCSPCSQFGYTPYCKKNAACMKQITVEEVYLAAIGLLER